MKELFLKMIEVFTKNEEIKDRYRTAGITPVQFVDLYAGQDRNPEYFEVPIYPALFVSFNIDHRQNPNLATVTVRCCYEQLRDTSSLSQNTSEALKFFDFMEITDSILDGMESEKLGKLDPATTDQEIEETVTDEFVLTYTASYIKKPTQSRVGNIEDVTIRKNIDSFKNRI